MEGSFDISGKKEQIWKHCVLLEPFDQLFRTHPRTTRQSTIECGWIFSKETISLECGLYDEVDEGLDALV